LLPGVAGSTALRVGVTEGALAQLAEVGCEGRNMCRSISLI